MSGLFGGDGGDVGDYKPGKAPKVPKLDDDRTREMAMKRLRQAQKANSYAAALLYESGGYAGAPAPTRSYASRLFGDGDGTGA